jgi:hypothetical protein
MTTPANFLVEADFIEDLRKMLSSNLSADGYTFDPNATAETLLHHDLQIRHRRIEQKPRSVSWSRELLAPSRDAELRLKEVRGPANSSHGRAWDALRRIEAAVTAGADLNLYTSRDMAPSNERAFTRNDWMLNDTGMHHFHMGAGLNSNGQINGTKDLLFVIVKSDVVYFVELFEHSSPKDERASWADESAFQIAQSNWPDLFQPAPLLRSNAGHSPITHEQRTALSKKNGNAPLTALDGTQYFQPGGGSTPSGIPVNVVIDAHGILCRLRAWEESCKANGEQLANDVEAHGFPRPSSLSLHLFQIEASGTVIVVQDTATATRIRVGGAALL